MRIAFFGSSLVSAYWNGAATYYRGLLRALAARGHDITFYEPDAFERQRHRDIDDPDWCRVIVYPANEAAMLDALGAARDADVIVKASGVGVFDDLLEEAVLEVAPTGRAGHLLGCGCAGYPRSAGRRERSVRANSSRSTTSSSPTAADRASSRAISDGARAPAFRSTTRSTRRRITRLRPTRAGPATFCSSATVCRIGKRASGISSSTPRRRRRIAVSCSAATAGQARHCPANVKPIGHVFTHQHNLLNGSALAVLNVNRDSMAAFGWSPPTRVFEVAGAAGCLITDAWEGIEAFLTPGEEVLVAANGMEVASLLEELSPQRARAIGEAAHRRVLAEHTYAQRAELVDRVLSGRRAEVPA